MNIAIVTSVVLLIVSAGQLAMQIICPRVLSEDPDSQESPVISFIRLALSITLLVFVILGCFSESYIRFLLPVAAGVISVVPILEVGGDILSIANLICTGVIIYGIF